MEYLVRRIYDAERRNSLRTERSAHDGKLLIKSHAMEMFSFFYQFSVGMKFERRGWIS